MKGNNTIEDVLKANVVITTSEGIQGQIWAWQEGQTLNLKESKCNV